MRNLKDWWVQVGTLSIRVLDLGFKVFKDTGLGFRPRFRRM